MGSATAFLVTFQWGQRWWNKCGTLAGHLKLSSLCKRVVFFQLLKVAVKVGSHDYRTISLLKRQPPSLKEANILEDVFVTVSPRCIIWCRTAWPKLDCVSFCTTTTCCFVPCFMGVALRTICKGQWKSVLYLVRGGMVVFVYVVTIILHCECALLVVAQCPVQNVWHVQQVLCNRLAVLASAHIQ